MPGISTTLVRERMSWLALETPDGWVYPTHLTLALRRSAPELRDRRLGVAMVGDNVCEV